MNIVPANSRGYLKIEGAVRAFNFDFRGKTVLDIGSSTGGFTELALKCGAKKVIAVEKGSHQMKAPLRFDPRVELHETPEIFTVSVRASRTAAESPSDSSSQAAQAKSSRSGEHIATILDAYPDVIVADISFLSLTKILKYAKMELARQSTQFLVMLKPQFEARPEQLNKGVVKNEKMRREILRGFEIWLKQNGFVVVKKHDNELRGKTGNIERFYYLQLEK